MKQNSDVQLVMYHEKHGFAVMLNQRRIHLMRARASIDKEIMNINNMIKNLKKDKRIGKLRKV